MLPFPTEQHQKACADKVLAVDPTAGMSVHRRYTVRYALLRYLRYCVIVRTCCITASHWVTVAREPSGVCIPRNCLIRVAFCTTPVWITHRIKRLL